MSQEIVSVYEKLKCPSSCSQQENNDLNFKNKELNSANNQNEQKMDSALLETGFFFFLEPPKRKVAYQHFNFSVMKPVLNFDLKNCTMINLSCFEPLHLW